MVGLDAAGKTTILYKLKLGEIVTTIPTIGTSLHGSITASAGKSTRLTGIRFQRRNGRIQEHFVYSVGCRRTGQDPTSLEALCVDFA